MPKNRNMTGQISESAELSITVRPKHSWDERMTTLKAAGEHMANELQKRGHAFKVEILGPTEMAPKEVDDYPQEVPLSSVILDLDWKIVTKLEMVDHARDILTRAFMLNSLDSALPSVLATIIEGRGLYEHGIGEFFLLYGKFEQKHRTSGSKTRDKMMRLVKGDPQRMKPYTERGKQTMEPLPYAVRNILAHTGTNPNTLDQDGNDLKTSIELLRGWVG